MNIRLALAAWSIALVASGPAYSQNQPDAIWSGDARVQQKVSVSVEGIPVEDLLAHLQAKTGVSLSATPDVSDEKVVIFGPSRPLEAVLEDLAALFNGTWTRQPAAGGGKPAYRIFRGLPARKQEEDWNRHTLIRMLAELDAQVRALAETPEQLARRPLNDPIRRALTDTEWGMRDATVVFSWLSPQQREAVLVQRLLRLPLSSFSRMQQDALRKILADTVEKQRQRAIANGGEPAGPGVVSTAEDLEHFGVTFVVRPGSSGVSVLVSLARGGELVEVRRLTITNELLLPPHGNPYNQAIPVKVGDLPAADLASSIPTGRPWVDRLKELAEKAKVPILADYYRGRPLIPVRSSTASAVPADPVAALDLFCQPTTSLWWTRGRSLLFRKRDWFRQRQREVPDRWMVATSGHLNAQEGAPSYSDLFRLRELSVFQICGLYNLAEPDGYPGKDELFFVGVLPLVELLRTAPRPLSGRLPVGEYSNPANALAAARITTVWGQLGAAQKQPFAQLMQVQQGMPLEALGGVMKLRCFSPSATSKEGPRNFRFVDVQLWWSVEQLDATGGGTAYISDTEFRLPLSLPDDRRDRTRVELEK